MMLIIGWLAVCLYSSLANPIVETNYGKVQGFSVELKNDLVADIFLRIPFAEPPLGDLRLEKPHEPKKWADVYNATNFGSACVQHSRRSSIKETDEDCLHLNIIAPKRKADKKYPVLLWIHASGWEILSGVSHGYAGIAERFVPREVLVVTINYRLGALGFMTTGNKNFNGNYGLWDQVAALKFVKENIEFFGGDANKITVSGASAGGASASALSLSPHSRDLFQQTIMMSGSLYMYTVTHTTDRVIDTSLKLATKLNCQQKDPTKTKNCIKTKTIDEIQDAVEAIGVSVYDVNPIVFNPRIDGDFFSGQFEEMIESAPKKPTLAGFTADEGSIITVFPQFNSVINGLIIDAEKQKTYSKQDLKTFIREVVAQEKIFEQKTKEVQKRLEEFYLDTKREKNSTDNIWLLKYTDIISDIHFNIPVLNDALSKSAHNWPVYLYSTEYYNENMLPKGSNIRGAPHLSEYPYLFGISFFDQFDFNSDDVKAQEFWVDTFSNFAKTGNPNPSNKYKWTPLEKEKLNYLKVGLEPKIKTGLKVEQLKFWNHLAKDFDYDIVRGVYKKNVLPKTEL